MEPLEHLEPFCVLVSSFSVEAGYLVEELEDWPGQPDIRGGDVIVAIGEEIVAMGAMVLDVLDNVSDLCDLCDLCDLKISSDI